MYGAINVAKLFTNVGEELCICISMCMRVIRFANVYKYLQMCVQNRECNHICKCVNKSVNAYIDLQMCEKICKCVDKSVNMDIQMSRQLQLTIGCLSHAGAGRWEIAPTGGV